MAKFRQKYNQASVDLTKSWKAKLAAQLVNKGNIRVSLGAFSVIGISAAYGSYIVYKYSVSLDNDFTILKPISVGSVNACLAVSWLDDSGLRIRRKLWAGIGEKLDAPLYNGEIINKSCTFEVWNKIGSSIASMSDYVLTLSILFDRDVCCPDGMAQENLDNTFGQIGGEPAFDPYDTYVNPYYNYNLPLEV